jgi:hypothetical protein
MPASNISRMTAGDSDAGPIVQTSLVLFNGNRMTDSSNTVVWNCSMRQTLF